MRPYCKSARSRPARRSVSLDWPLATMVRLDNISCVHAASERGIVSVKLNAVGREEPLFAGQRWTSEQPVWNDECVTKLPEGARVFGSTPGAKFAAWGLGPWVVGIDWHPEWDAKEIAEAANASGPVASPSIAAIERLGRLFAERVSMILMPVDRMVSGRAKDVRH